MQSETGSFPLLETAIFYKGCGTQFKPGRLCRRAITAKRGFQNR